jgi:outer membrane biogenesis lipoprotein LolB
MSWDEFDKFEREMKKFDIFGNSRYTEDIERSKAIKEWNDRGNEIEITIELPIGSAQRIEDLSYRIFNTRYDEYLELLIKQMESVIS